MSFQLFYGINHVSVGKSGELWGCRLCERVAVKSKCFRSFAARQWREKVVTCRGATFNEQLSTHFPFSRDFPPNFTSFLSFCFQENCTN